MKISCSACSKKYDALKTEGICPYCGMHATDQQISLSQENDRVKGGSATEVLRSYLNERLRRQRKQSPLRQKKIQIPLCIFMVAALIGLGLWGNHYYNTRRDYYTSRRSTAEVATEHYKLGESVVIGNVNIQITGSRIREDLQSKVTGGFKILEVTYHDTGAAGRDRLSDAYVRTADGCTAKSLERYDACELLGITEQQYIDSEYEGGVFSSYTDTGSDHKLLFAVPEKENTHTILLFKTTNFHSDDKRVEACCEFTLGEGAGS
ncbi:MAG: hypothetical protein IKN17_02815 [Ruminococcus sp.]|nr:hypothetical protein [Ruminococcus sp.]